MAGHAERRRQPARNVSAVLAAQGGHGPGGARVGGGAPARRAQEENEKGLGPCSSCLSFRSSTTLHPLHHLILPNAPTPTASSPTTPPPAISVSLCSRSFPTWAGSCRGPGPASVPSRHNRSATPTTATRAWISWRGARPPR